MAQPQLRGFRDAIVTIAVRPTLWPVALRQARRMVRRDWWRTAPFLPVPDPAYVAFRLETQYGAAGAPSAHDVVTYLAWCRDQERLRSDAQLRRLPDGRPDPPVH